MTNHKLPSLPAAGHVTTEVIRDQNARHRVFLATTITVIELAVLFYGVSLTTHVIVGLGVFGKDLAEIILDMLDSDL